MYHFCTRVPQSIIKHGDPPSISTKCLRVFSWERLSYCGRPSAVIYPVRADDPLLPRFIGKELLHDEHTHTRDVSVLDHFSRLRIINYSKQKSRNDFKTPQVVQCNIRKGSAENMPVYLAALELPLTNSENSVIAYGVSKSMKEAETCAFMHAEDILTDLNIAVYQDRSRQKQYCSERMKQGRKVVNPDEPEKETAAQHPPLVVFIKNTTQEGKKKPTLYENTLINSSPRQVIDSVSQDIKFDLKADPTNIVPSTLEKSLALHFNPENFLKNIFRCDGKDLETEIESIPLACTTKWTVYVGYRRTGEEGKCNVHWLLNASGKAKVATLRYASVEVIRRRYICQFREHEEFFKHYMKAINSDDIALDKEQAIPITYEYAGQKKYSNIARASLKKADLEVKEMYKGEVRHICRSTAANESLYHIVDPDVLNVSCRSRMDLWFRLRKQGKHLGELIEYFKVAEGGLNNSNIFQAEIKLPIPEKIFGKRLAIGIAHKKKDASLAAVQHAELILDAIGVPVMPTWPYYIEKNRMGMRSNHSTQHPQDIRATKTRTCNRWAPGTRDLIRPKVPSPLPLSVKPDEVVDGAQTSHFVSMSEIGPCHRVKVQNALRLANANHFVSGDIMVFSKLLMHVGKVSMALPEEYGGEMVGQGIARSNAKAVHIAFTNAYQILQAVGVIDGYPKRVVEIPPPLLLLDTNVDSSQTQMQTTLGDSHHPPDQTEVKKLLNADTSDGFILVKEQDAEKNKIINIAIPNPRLTDPHCIVRTRAFYRGLTKNIHSELPIQIEECRGGNVYYRRGTFSMKLPHPFPQISICAEARTKKEVQILCSMHLELQLDAIGYPLNNTKATQFNHAMAARSCGRDAPLDIDVKAPVESHIVVPPLRKDYGDEVTSLMSEGSVLSQNESSDANVRYNLTEKIDGLQTIESRMFDTKARSFSHVVEEYLLSYDQSVASNTECVFKSSLFYVKCYVPMPHNIPKQLAIGASRIKKEAEQLCFLHFVFILHAFNIRIFQDEVEHSSHMAFMASLGQPVHNSDVIQFGTRVPHGLHMDVPRKPVKPVLQHYNFCEVAAWEEFCKICEFYVFDKRSYIDAMSSAHGPRSGDELIDEAQKESEKQELDTHCKTVLYNFCNRVGIPYPQTKVVVTHVNGKPKFLATIKLKDFEWIGTGTENAHRNADLRATMHCIEVLKRTHPEFNSETDLSTRMKEKSDGQMSTWMGNTITNVGFDRITDMYTRCNDLMTPKLSVKYTDGGICATALIEEEGERYEGKGKYGNRAVAEQMAREALCIRMRNLPKFAALVGLFRQHPKLDPENVFSLDSINSFPEVDVLCNAVGSHEEGAEKLKEDDEKETSMWNVDEISISSEDIGHPSTETNRKRSMLPIFQYRKDIMEKMRSTNVIVLSGTTGCGKTTQLPQYILEECASQNRPAHILVTQPRRITAISVARRVAQERGQSVGGSVGYSVRFEHHAGRHLNFISIGILLRIITNNPMLRGISHVIVDEVHERDLNTDFVLLILKRIVLRRSNLKVVIMSATLQSDSFSGYFGGVPIVHVDHPIHPVKEYYLEDICTIAKGSSEDSMRVKGTVIEQQLLAIESQKKLAKASDGMTLSPARQVTSIDYKLIKFLTQHCVESHQMLSLGGSILVFLPGWNEIQQAREVLEQSVHASVYQIIVLHSAVSPNDQLECFLPAKRGCVKIILATNIAESGITIDDVVCVLDTGKVKEKRMICQSDGTKASTVTTLMTVNASQANCIQRKGRAGRTREGFCYRLFSRTEYLDFKEFRSPEILRLPLEGICLSILNQRLGTPTAVLKSALDSPSPAKIEIAMDFLKSIGAVSSTGALTPLGKQIARIPASPNTAKMLIIGCRLNCLDLALTLAASMEVNLFKITQDTGKHDVSVSRDILSEGELSDQYCYLNAYNKYSDVWQETQKKERFIEENNLNEQALLFMSKMKRQLYEELINTGFIDLDHVKDHFSKGTWKEKDVHTHPTKSLRSTVIAHIRSTKAPFVEMTGYSHMSYSKTLFKGLMSVMCYPNVAIRMDRDFYRSKIDDTLKVMSTSVVRAGRNASPFVVFFEKIARLSAFRNTDVTGELRNVTNVGVWTLLLFGTSTGQFHYRHDLNLCIIDNWLIFKLSALSYEKLLTLRKAFDLSLEPDKHVNTAVRKRIVAALSAASRKLCEEDEVHRFLSRKDRN